MTKKCKPTFPAFQITKQLWACIFFIRTPLFLQVNVVHLFQDNIFIHGIGRSFKSSNKVTYLLWYVFTDSCIVRIATTDSAFSDFLVCHLYFRVQHSSKIPSTLCHLRFSFVTPLGRINLTVVIVTNKQHQALASSKFEYRQRRSSRLKDEKFI